ncbi:MAG: zinc ribbon domain-containing protein, partial [Planctomycetes bacterium]|nr:zinc ribbon domain-containing protein [Planctomycetota bacterium]
QNPEAVIEKVFQLAPGQTEQQLGTLALSRARAYRIAYPEGDYDRRLDVWSQLRQAQHALEAKARSATRDDESRRRCATISAYLAEEILSNIDLHESDREALLEEAKDLTITESSLWRNHPAAEFRLGRISVFLDPSAELLPYAERAIDLDATRDFDPAYEVVFQSYRDLTASEPVSDADRPLVNRLEEHLVEYRGENPQIIATREAITRERRLAEAAAREAAAREESARKEREARAEHAKLYRKCPNCFVEVLKTETSCPHCGEPLPPVSAKESGGS